MFVSLLFSLSVCYHDFYIRVLPGWVLMQPLYDGEYPRSPSVLSQVDMDQGRPRSKVNVWPS